MHFVALTEKRGSSQASDAHRSCPSGSPSSACFLLPGERSWTGESPALGEEEHHGRSTRDGDRAFAQAEDKSTEGTLPGAVWRGITVFEWRAPVSADCLALAGEGSGKSE